MVKAPMAEGPPKAVVYAIKASKLVRRCLAGIPDYFSLR
jgi:hypothetical protein